MTEYNPNTYPSVVYVATWGFPGGRLDPGGYPGEVE